MASTSTSRAARLNEARERMLRAVASVEKAKAEFAAARGAMASDDGEDGVEWHAWCKENGYKPSATTEDFMA